MERVSSRPPEAGSRAIKGVTRQRRHDASLPPVIYSPKYVAEQRRPRVQNQSPAAPLPPPFRPAPTSNWTPRGRKLCAGGVRVDQTDRKATLFTARKQVNSVGRSTAQRTAGAHDADAGRAWRRRKNDHRGRRGRPAAATEATPPHGRFRPEEAVRSERKQGHRTTPRIRHDTRQNKGRQTTRTHPTTLARPFGEPTGQKPGRHQNPATTEKISWGPPQKPAAERETGGTDRQILGTLQGETRRGGSLPRNAAARAPLPTATQAKHPPNSRFPAPCERTCKKEKERPKHIAWAGGRPSEKESSWLRGSAAFSKPDAGEGGEPSRKNLYVRKQASFRRSGHRPHRSRGWLRKGHRTAPSYSGMRQCRGQSASRTAED